MSPIFRRCLDRAWRDTWDYFPPWKEIAGSLLIFGLTIGASLYRKGSTELPDIQEAIITGLIGVSGTWIIFYLFNLACAPYRIEKERADQAERQLAKAPRTSAPLAKRPVSFWLPGPSGMTPFRIAKSGSDADGLINSEQLWLRIQADQNMRDVHVVIQLLLRHDVIREVKLDDEFSGAVCKGMQANIKLMERRYQYRSCIVPKSDGSKKEYNVRCDLDVTFFPGLPNYLTPDSSLYTFIVKVFHADGPETASFILSIADIVRPWSALHQLNGNISPLSER